MIELFDNSINFVPVGELCMFKEKSVHFIKQYKDIAVDFDGTCCAHAYPEIGADIGAIQVLKELKTAGHRLFLYTMRNGTEAMVASEWLTKQGVLLDGVNMNPDVGYYHKILVDVNIDDRNLGIPLKVDKALSELPFVDWVGVRKLLVKAKLL
jgi:hypothetical protein